MKISVITDDEKSWFIPYGKTLVDQLANSGHQAIYVDRTENILYGDICFILSCTKIIKKDILSRNTNNIVVHASDLPAGRGFSPIQWQILNGQDEICLTLFEVNENIDDGPYYLKRKVSFQGTELLLEIRNKIGVEIIELCLEYVNNIKLLNPILQVGEKSEFRRRTDKDDEIDPNKSIIELFNHFRIADFDRHPLYFFINGKKYTIRIDVLN